MQEPLNTKVILDAYGMISVNAQSNASFEKQIHISWVKNKKLNILKTFTS